MVTAMAFRMYFRELIRKSGRCIMITELIILELLALAVVVDTVAVVVDIHMLGMVVALVVVVAMYILLPIILFLPQETGLLLPIQPMKII